MKVREVKSKKKGNRTFPNIQPKPQQVPWPWAEVPVEAASSSAGNSPVPMGFPGRAAPGTVTAGPAWHFLIPHPTGNVPPKFPGPPRVSSGNPRICRKGARDGDRIPNQNRSRGKGTGPIGGRTAPITWDSLSPPHPSIPQKLPNTNTSSGTSPKASLGSATAPWN